MKTIITTRAAWSSMEDFIAGKPPAHEETFQYEGPMALADRAARAQAQTAANTAGSTAATLGSEAEGEHSQLAPFFSQEMHAEHGYDPTQLNEMLTYAGAGTGGAAGSLVGQANLEAARTRNASGFTKSLDEAARDKEKAAAGISEGIAAQDVNAAKKLNQEGAQGMSGLYGTDTKGQLDAMGLQTGDINAELAADKTGWVQNMNDTLSAVGNLTSGAGKLLKPGSN